MFYDLSSVSQAHNVPPVTSLSNVPSSYKNSGGSAASNARDFQKRFRLGDNIVSRTLKVVYGQMKMTYVHSFFIASFWLMITKTFGKFASRIIPESIGNECRI